MKRTKNAIRVPTIIKVNITLQPVQDILSSIKRTGEADVINDVFVFRMDNDSNNWIDVVYFLKTFTKGFTSGMSIIDSRVRADCIASVAENLSAGTLTEEVIDSAIAELEHIRKVMYKMSVEDLKTLTRTYKE